MQRCGLEDQTIEDIEKVEKHEKHSDDLIDIDPHISSKVMHDNAGEEQNHEDEAHEDVPIGDDVEQGMEV